MEGRGVRRRDAAKNKLSFVITVIAVRIDR